MLVSILRTSKALLFAVVLFFINAQAYAQYSMDDLNTRAQPVQNTNEMMANKTWIVKQILFVPATEDPTMAPSIQAAEKEINVFKNSEWQFGPQDIEGPLPTGQYTMTLANGSEKSNVYLSYPGANNFVIKEPIDIEGTQWSGFLFSIDGNPILIFPYNMYCSVGFVFGK